MGKMVRKGGLEGGVFLSRRGFVKGAAASLGAAALYGCSKDDGGDIIYSGTGGETTIAPEVSSKEEIYVGTAPHNCGGGACVLKAHVSGGRIVRFSTDERPDHSMVFGYSDYDAQRRGCVRCRSKKQWLYRTDRLLYPLKQTGNRGDLSAFKRITWKQAYEEIATETKRIADIYGPESLHRFYSTGDGATYPRARQFSANILYKLGGEYQYHDDYSFPSWYTAAAFTHGQMFAINANSAPDLKNADLIVMWGCNTSEMISECNASWYITQARDMGVPVVSVDQRLSKTATTLSTGYKNVPAVLTPVSGTDSAVIAAMLYHLLDSHLAWCAANGVNAHSASPYLDVPFIKKYVHGFFDDCAPETYSYRADITQANYPVPDGASYSAYIFGSDDRLVTAGLNKAVSIYPDKIGYNVSKDPEYPDVLSGKYAPCYGQVPKKPEWASVISGLKAQDIKNLAEAIVSAGNVSILYSGGFQRNTEGEQNPRALMVLGAVTKCFGRSGATYGNPGGSAAVGTVPGFATKSVPWADAAVKSRIESGTVTNPAGSGFVFAPRFDDTKLTVSRIKKDGTNYASFPVFMWQDAIENGGTGKSRWGCKDIGNGPAMKLIYNFGGNCVVNQCGNYALTTQILSMANRQAALTGQDPNYPNRKYQLELLVTSDYFMTSSAQWSDYVLPAAMAFEKTFYKTSGDAVHFSPKAVNPPAEVQSDFAITLGIADRLGFGYDLTTDGIREEDALLRKDYRDNGTGITYDEFKKRGVVTSGSSGKTVVMYETFYKDPAANPMPTATGKIEAYSQAMMEYYEARLFDNYDPVLLLEHNGELVTKSASAGSADAKKARIVYPVPMYIPLVEGRHYCDGDANVPAFGGTATSVIDSSVAYGATQHPDLTGSASKGYPYRLHTWHMQYRSHSTLNSNAYLNELYKVNGNGEAAFYALDRGQSKVYGTHGAVTDDNLYEPVFVDPRLASEIGLPAAGARVVIYNDRGAMYAYAKSSPLVGYGEIMIGQGSWAFQGNEEFTTPVSAITHKIDKGGCANTLTDIRPSRICQGMTLANDCKVGIRIL